MKNTLKQIFNFFCFFIICPFVGICSLTVFYNTRWLEVACLILVWLWLILAYKYLIKLFD